MYFKFDALEVATAETGAPHPRASLDESLADLPTGGTTCYSGRVPEGGWPLPGPIPSSYYSREALPRPIGLTRALDRLELRAPSLRGLQIPHLGGRERLLAAAVAVAVLFLGGVIGLATRGSASTPHGQPPGPGRQAAAPAPTSTAQTIAPTALPTPTPTPAT